MMSHNNWEFMRGVVNTYGSAARLNDFFNVSDSILPPLDVAAYLYIG